MSESVFTAEGEVLIPSEHARGPWDVGSMHGGGPAALIARAVERLETPVPMRCVRLAYEFVGAVPLQPVIATARFTRGGKRLALVEASLTTTDGTEVLRARGTLLRIGEVALPEAAWLVDPPLPGPEAGTPAHWSDADETVGFHLSAIELRVAAGTGPQQTGPALGWFRLALPLVEGEAPTPLQRTVAVADFGNGLSRALAFDTHLFVNTDLTVHLHREPEGEWIALDARTDLDPAGLGQATSVLHDARGRFGTAAQSLFVAER
jgi:acyl-coenzyme A thioesterase PaaI-like protein